MSYLTLIGAIYLIVGISSLTCISIHTFGPLGWPIPLPNFKWDKHGLSDTLIGAIYLITDGLIFHGIFNH